jgi:7-cyano-7-deazaguanine synthase
VKSRNANRERGIVLLSGGLDSTVSLALAQKSFDLRIAIFFDYRQHASSREEACSREIARHYGLSYKRIELPWLGDLSSSVLISGKGKPPRLSPVNLDKRGVQSSRSTWVENRNGIFINIAAAFAAVSGCEILVTGFNREEAEAYPDNSSEFLELVNRALEVGAGSPVRVESPTISMTKRDIVKEGVNLSVPWNLLWSCYRGGDVMCGTCESCLRLKRAVAGTPAEVEIIFAKETS